MVSKIFLLLINLIFISGFVLAAFDSFKKSGVGFSTLVYSVGAVAVVVKGVFDIKT